MIINKSSCLANIWLKSLNSEMDRYSLKLTQQFGIPSVLARILVARSIDECSINSYLNPKLRDLLPPPHKFKDMDKAVKRILLAIQRQEKITIYGDYDVDGACSSTIFATFLRNLGLQVDIFIPNRIQHGYGLNLQQLKNIKTNGTNLIIAVDCGSNEIIEDINIDIIVFDHHKISNFNNIAYALVNPNREDDNSECNYLCATGVAFIAIAFLASLLKKQENFKIAIPNVLEYLDLVALATICDVVPLIGVNRAFVLNGIAIASKLQNKGLATLIETLDLAEPFNTYNMAYIIGPHINAAGRIDNANIGVQLLCSQNIAEARELSKTLAAVNIKRRTIEQENLENIIFKLHTKYENTKLPSVIVEIGDWHQGIVGLLASRLKDKYMRPAIILSKQNDEYAVGSARSVSSIDIGNLIQKAVAENLVEKGGGHAMAAGLTIKQSKLDNLIEWLNIQISKKIGELYETSTLKIESIINAEALTVDLYNEIEKAGPYGAGNPRPLILVNRAFIKFYKIVGEKHIAITLSSDTGIKKAIAFRAVGTALENFLQNNLNKYCDLVGYLNLNYYRNTINPQLQIIDAA